MITVAIVGLLLGYAGATGVVKVKNEVELNSMRAEVGLPTKPVLEKTRLTGVWN